MASGFSIIICCYNSSSRIEETLKYAFALNTGANIHYEIIVVDNKSIDQTAEASIKAARNYNLNNIPFRVVYEPLPGLSNARRCGMKEAVHELILFCDDDNHLQSDYLVSAAEVLKSNKDIAILGGWCRPKLTINPGPWIVDFYPALAIDEKPKADSDQSWIYGAGMIIRKSIFSELTERNITFQLSDRVGTKQTSGGDCELCILTRFLGYRVHYSSTLILDHQVSTHRLRKSSFVKGNFRNVYPVIYLYLLDSLFYDRQKGFSTLYWAYMKQQFKHLFYFLPRMIVGRHQFYSFIQFYQGLQLLLWLMVNRKAFGSTRTGILKNLFHG